MGAGILPLTFGVRTLSIRVVTMDRRAPGLADAGWNDHPGHGDRLHAPAELVGGDPERLVGRESSGYELSTVCRRGRAPNYGRASASSSRIGGADSRPARNPESVVRPRIAVTIPNAAW